MRFSLKSALLAVIVVAILIGAARIVYQPYVQERATAERFRELGATVTNVEDGPDWIRRIGFAAYGYRVTSISFPPKQWTYNYIPEFDMVIQHGPEPIGIEEYHVPLADQQHLGMLTALEVLEAPTTDISSVEHLASLRGLQTLDLSYTQITDAGIREIVALNRFVDI